MSSSFPNASLEHAKGDVEDRAAWSVTEREIKYVNRCICEWQVSCAAAELAQIPPHLSLPSDRSLVPASSHGARACRGGCSEPGWVCCGVSERLPSSFVLLRDLGETPRFTPTYKAQLSVFFLLL